MEDSEEFRKRVQESVQKWVEDNPVEFGAGKYYRDRIFERCKKYFNMSNDHLEIALESIPDFMKWYFTVFQVIFIAGTLTIATTALFVFITNLSLEFGEISILRFSIPLVIFVAILVFIFLPHKENGQRVSSYLSQFVQHKFDIIKNLRELEIEMKFISTILEMREATQELD